MSVSLLWLTDGIVDLAPSDVRVADLCLDSRAVKTGSLFFALPGKKTHGLEFVAEAIARGASAVLWDHGDNENDHGVAAQRAALAAALSASSGSVFVARVARLRNKMGRMADRFFNWPSSHLRICAITGTNGKTTCAYLLAQCLERLGMQSAYMGTLGWGPIAHLESPTHTTPDVISVHRQLAALRAKGVREVAMEVSSHALDQERVAGVRFYLAAFTNLSRDHLDYHGTMQAYAEAKAQLFSMPDLQQIIINMGDAFGREIVQRYVGSVPVTAVWVGSGNLQWTMPRTLYVERVVSDLQGIGLDLQGSLGAAHVNTKLLGRFNAENSVLVLASLISLGVPLESALRVLSQCVPPPGRMELLDTSIHAPMAVIDYAHTPDALAKALSAMRQHCEGALWCVFGCGGDRDAGKRALMGAIADEHSDEIIITDDNPRSEDPEAIAQAIVAGIKSRKVRIIHDRAKAISTALTEASSRDAVLIAGKGHEEVQVYGKTSRPFSDRHEALRCLGVAA